MELGRPQSHMGRSSSGGVGLQSTLHIQAWQPMLGFLLGTIQIIRFLRPATDLIRLVTLGIISAYR
jgi:hypothetical protein